ncbi:tetratricopeptide repeat protein 21B-like isoform X1 [Acipenser oxyrinchus oxyrinchus]|uniref:Tetratricopeptide repeat protein 21B-like isoform X1 n=1 Tax=Acipenser oxyrinchus oxyrinchus TaxID=40147 RepID=A0AAD8GCQ4_ACIOX|nr:tetratricopeptide repeat protein 21B-like isoform X1 [Acipenser oxyrinchus oxyrinchus]
MADTDPTCLASLTYYCQEKYYRHVMKIASEYLKSYTNDPVLLFFKAYGILMEGRTQEAIRELNQVKHKTDVSLCSTMALIYAHKQSDTVDRDAIVDLESELKINRKTAREKTLYYAGMFLWLLGRSDKAKEYIDRMLKIADSSREGLVLKGWIELNSDKEFNRNKSIRYFDDGVQDSKDAIGLMGKVKYFMKRQNYSGAHEIVNQIVVSHPSFLPSLIIKMKLFLAQQDWDQALETAQRILQKDRTNVDALQTLVVHSLAKDGNLAKAADSVRVLISALETAEPCNASLHLHIITPISRLCGKNPAIQSQIYGLAQRAFLMAPTDADIATEVGYLLTLQGNIREAAKWYSNAVNLDGNSLPALAGIIRCQLLEGQLVEAEQQLEFLREVQQSLGKSREVVYLQAVLASKQGQDEEAVSTLLKEALELHFSALEGLPLGGEYFEKLNPAFLLEVVKGYLDFCPNKPWIPGQSLPFVLKHSAMILDPVVKAAPALLEAVYLLAKVKYLSGDFEAAQSCLQRCLELDSTFAEAHLLMAQVYLSTGDFKQCSHSLEMAVSFDFKVRELPVYHFIRAKALKKTGNLPEAIKTLQMILSLPGMRRGGAGKAAGAPSSSSDRVSVYLELAEALCLNGEQHEATKIMQDAIVEFTGTPDEMRVTLANVDLALSKGDTETALSVLRNITPTHPYYTEAKEKMADIYLHKRNDKRLYIGCYRELWDRVPGAHSSLLLGDAYMKIQEPEKAIEMYEQALKKNTRDAVLASRTGQALVKTHQYNKAINYYEAALKIKGQDFLYHDLAELFLKLKQYDQAKKLLQQVLEHDYANDLILMMNGVKYLILLAKVYTQSGDPKEAIETLNKAYDVQSRVLRRLSVDQPERMPSQRKVASLICSQIAQQGQALKEYEMAIKYYKEALTYSEADSKIMLELANLYLEQGDVDSCQHQCAMLLKKEDDNEDAAMMMADLMFRRQDYEKAILHYRQLMERASGNFSVLAKLIDLLRRTGKLDDAPAFLEMAEKTSTRSTLEPGYNYCQGLYLWHMGQPNEALRHLNKARKDTEWGQDAVYNMIQICLNPDNETIGGEVFVSIDEETSNSNNLLKERQESEEMAVRTALNLLKEYHPRTLQGEKQVLLLQNCCLMASKDKTNVEKALIAFTEMASSEKEHVSSLLAMAQAFMILKQTPRARNQLKRITKVAWNAAEAEDLEKCWLLLADIYIQSGKFDIATDLLKRCLLYNKSCCKAFEYLGFIMEKEQSYKDAASNYEMAWKYSNRVNPAIGYKLAFNYLKDKKYTEAIHVCHKVLTDHPDYPKIRKDILEKAQFSLRP